MTINMLMFVLMMPIAGIGFLMKYVLVSGAQRKLDYGQEVDLLYLGLDRHQWGSIHLFLSFILLFLLLLHILLHWKMISHWFKAKVSSSLMRLAVGIGFILICVVFGLLPIFVRPEVTVGIKHHAHTPHQYQTKHYDSPSVPLQNVRIELPKDSLTTLSTEFVQDLQLSDESHHQHSDINGQMTLHHIAEESSFSEKDLCLHFGIPEGQAQQRLGRLRKQYGFSLEELRTYINNKD